MSKHGVNPLGRLAQRPRMLVYLIAAFDEAWAAFRRKLETVPFMSWDESAFRHLYIESLRKLNPSLRTQLEWRRFDLLVQSDDESVLIEFKFFLVKWHDHLNGERRTRPKGHPSDQNFREFAKCASDLEKLRCGIDGDDVSKISARFLFLVYGDHPDWKGKTYADWYDDVQLPESALQHEELTELHRTPPLRCPFGEDEIKSRLYMLTGDPLNLPDIIEILDRNQESNVSFRCSSSERIAHIEHLRKIESERCLTRSSLPVREQRTSE